MYSRYTFRPLVVNRSEAFREWFDRRKINFVRQYSTPQMSLPSAEDIADLTTIGHIWTLGDRFYKLAHQHYGNSELWWVIAWFNQTPMEAQVTLGDVIEIPLPIERVLRMLEV